MTLALFELGKVMIKEWKGNQGRESSLYHLDRA